VLTEELFKRFPNADEGSLTKVRSRLVNRRYLAELGQRLDLGRHLVLGRGDEIQGGRERPSTLADAFEALLGAIFLDAGWLAAREFLLRLYRDRFDGLLSAPDSDNPKGELQELLQVGSAAPPTYQLKRTVGPDHDRLFECAVYHQGVELGRGRGKSKKDAETQAARTALAGLRARRQALDNGRADAEAPQ
jgi:ribonuclease-3